MDTDAWRSGGVRRSWEQISCDGLFLIFDTAAHVQVDVDEAEVLSHVDECATCSNLGTSRDDAQWSITGYRAWLKAQQQ